MPPVNPYVMPGSNHFQITHYFRSKYMNIFSIESSWSVDTTPTPAHMDLIAAYTHGTFGDQFVKVMDHESNYAATKCRFRNLEDVDIEAIFAEDLPGARGAVLEDGGLELESLPTYACAIFRRITGKPGRQSRGRFFMPLISEVVQHDGIIDSGDRDDFRVIADLFQSDLEAPDCPVLHARHWNRKDNILQVVIKCNPMDQLVTRRDRKLGGISLPISV